LNFGVSRNRFCDFLADPDSRSFSRFYTNIARSRYKAGIKHGNQVQTIDMNSDPSAADYDPTDGDSSRRCTVVAYENEIQLKDAAGRLWNLRVPSSAPSEDGDDEASAEAVAEALRWRDAILEACPTASEGEYEITQDSLGRSAFEEGLSDGEDAGGVME
jgi:hypothetical protein